MKVFVFTYDRYDSITTSLMLETEGIEHTVLCHTEEQKQNFIAGGLVKEERIIATGEPKGLARNRNWVLDKLEEGEWCLMLVDDLKSITELNNYDRAQSPLPITFANQKRYKERFDTQITMSKFLMRAEKLSKVADGVGCYLAGFCNMDNPMFRQNHYKTNVLVDGRAIIVKKSHMRYDPVVQTIDDYCFTAINLTETGIVFIDNWILPDCRRYTKGGYGTLDERMIQKMSDVDYLVRNWPQWLAVRDKANHPRGSHVGVRQRGKKPKIQ